MHGWAGLGCCARPANTQIQMCCSPCRVILSTRACAACAHAHTLPSRGLASSKYGRRILTNVRKKAPEAAPARPDWICWYDSSFKLVAGLAALASADSDSEGGGGNRRARRAQQAGGARPRVSFMSIPETGLAPCHTNSNESCPWYLVVDGARARDSLRGHTETRGRACARASHMLHARQCACAHHVTPNQY